MTMLAGGETVLRKYRILVVDDHPLVRRGLSELISQEPDLVVCGEAADLAEAMRQVRENIPDVVIIDLSLKNGHGIELIEQIRSQYPGIRMLVSSVHDESLFAERVLRAGAVGYVNKQESTEKVIEAIRHILDGEIYLSTDTSNRLLRSVVSGQPRGQNPIQTLSNRELEVFEMIGQGLSTKQIASRLKLSPKTVETHREKIKKKLKLANSTELSRHAVQWVLESQ